MNYKNLDTHNLWAVNGLEVTLGEDTTESGRELMRRTDTSRKRVERSNAECADRAERHPA